MSPVRADEPFSAESGVIPGGIAEGVRVRVAICGAAGVGKSALVTRLIHPTAFRPEYVPDTKVEVCVKAMRIKTSIEAEVPPRLLSCEVYDIPGNLEVPLDAELIGSLHGIVICVDGSINDPFKGVYRYIDHMRGLPSGSPMAREGPRASKLSSMRTKSISAGSREPPTPLSIPHADDGNVGGSHGRLSSAASQPSVPAAGSVVSGAEHWEDLRGQIPAVVCVCKVGAQDTGRQSSHA